MAKLKELSQDDSEECDEEPPMKCPKIMPVKIQSDSEGSEKCQSAGRGASEAGLRPENGDVIHKVIEDGDVIDEEGESMVVELNTNSVGAQETEEPKQYVKKCGETSGDPKNNNGSHVKDKEHLDPKSQEEKKVKKKKDSSKKEKEPADKKKK